MVSNCRTDHKVGMKMNVVNAYIEAINNARMDKICGLLTEDHVFIDSQNNTCIGIDKMRIGWTSYFEMFPDYKIEINETFVNDTIICLLGYASGTYKNLKNKENSNFWRIPAAWKVMVKDNKIGLWQVYADNIIVMDIINRNQ